MLVLIALGFIGAALLFVFTSKSIKRKKTVGGAVLFISAVLGLLLVQFAVQNFIQRELTEKPISGFSSPTERIAEARDMQSKVNLMGYGLGALGLVLLLAGLITEKKTEA